MLHNCTLPFINPSLYSTCCVCWRISSEVSQEKVKQGEGITGFLGDVGLVNTEPKALFLFQGVFSTPAVEFHLLSQLQPITMSLTKYILFLSSQSCFDKVKM